MDKINLYEFLDGVRGRPYKALVEHHIKKQKTKELLHGCLGTIGLLPPKLQPFMEEFIDHMNTYAYNKAFWDLSCDAAFQLIEEEARNKLPIDDLIAVDQHNRLSESSQELLFNIFQIVTLSYAYSASDQPQMRRFIGIKKGFFG
ncbi:MAG: hypothetical protein H5U02_04985 [Clostridia bacterium]|nr:hypothetical protein [Clostridia bacterium]